MKRALAILIVVGLAGCGSSRRDAPLLAQATDLQDPKLALGRQAFAINCYQCHPGGDGGLAPAINNKPVPAWLIKTQIRAGLGSMPSFSKSEISDEERDAIAAYLVHLRKQKTVAAK